MEKKEIAMITVAILYLFGIIFLFNIYFKKSDYYKESEKKGFPLMKYFPSIFVGVIVWVLSIVIGFGFKEYAFSKKYIK